MSKEMVQIILHVPLEKHQRLEKIASWLKVSLEDYILDCMEEKLDSLTIPKEQTRKVLEGMEKGIGITVSHNMEEFKRNLGC